MGYGIAAATTVPIGTVGGAAEGVLWAWNETDVSQFGDGVGGPTAADGTVHGALAVAAFPGGLDASINTNRLVYTHATASGTRAFYMINDLPVLPDKFIVEGRIGPRQQGTLGVNTNPQVILAYQDISHHMALMRASGGSNLILVTGNGNDGRTTASTLTGPVATANADEGDMFRVICDIRDPTGATDPGMRFWYDTIDDGNRFRASSSTWVNVGGATPPSASWDAGWRTGGTVKRIGIAFAEQANNGSGYVSELKIRTFSPV